MSNMLVTEEEFQKLKEAIDVVVKNQLMENHDDTLLEKLLTNMEGLVTTEDLDDDQVKDLLTHVSSLMDNSGDSDSGETKDPTPVALKLLAILLSRFGPDASLCEDTETAFSSFILAVSLVTSESDVSFQSSVVYCLKMFLHHDFLITMTLSNAKLQWPQSSSKCNNFLQILYILMIKSSSYFVRHDAESLLRDIFFHHPDIVCGWSSSVSYHSKKFLAKLMKDILENPIRENIHFLNLLNTPRQPLRRFLTRTGVREVMSKHLEHILSQESQSFDVKLFHGLIDFLGGLMPNQEDVDKITTFCLKKNDLKGLIIFTSKLLSVDREYISKWLLYSLYTLVAKTDRRIEVSQQIMTSIREKSFVEKNANYSEVLCVISRLPSTFNNLDDRGSLVVDALQILIQSKLSSAKKTSKSVMDRKVISEALACLMKAFEFDIIIDVDFNDILCDLILEAANVKSPDGPVSESFVDLMSTARVFWSSEKINVQSSITAKVLSTLAKVMSCNKFCKKNQTNGNTIEDNLHAEYEEVDWKTNCVECIMFSLQGLFFPNGADCFPLPDSFCQAFQSLWNQYRDEKWFLSSVIPILFTLDFELDGEKLSSLFGWSRHKEGLKAIFGYLRDPFLAHKAVDTLCNENHLIAKLPCLRHDYIEVFQELVSCLCLHSLQSVDTEVQRSIFKFFQLMIENSYMYDRHSPNKSSEDRNRTEEDFVQILYTTGLLTTVMMVHESDLYSSNSEVRLTAFEISEKIRQSLHDLKLDAQGFKNLLNETSLPNIFSRESEQIRRDENHPVISIEHRKNVIEDMFQGFVRQPTIDFISQLNNRPVDNVSEASHPLPKTEITLSELCHYYTKIGVYTQAEEFCSLRGILDDILAAKDTANAAVIDCY